MSPAPGQLLGGQSARRVQLVAPGETEVAGEDGRALAEPGTVAGPAARAVQSRNRPVAEGIPRRMSLRSMTSSCSSAAPWKNSMLAASLTSASESPPPAAR